MSTQKTFDARILCEHENYMMTLHESPGNTDNRLLISFGPANSDFSTSGFATAVAKKLGIDSIYVAQRLGTYYQGLDVDSFVRIVAPHLPGRDVITYGGSLGGWCAFYFGGAIGARIIGFSPLNPGHPDFRTNGFVKPLMDYAHIDLKDLPASPHRHIVVYDPHRLGDLQFVDRFITPTYPDMARYEVPFAGHNVLDRMKRAGTLKQFVTMALNGEFPEAIKIREEGCSFWHQERARVFRSARDHDSAEFELRAAYRADVTKVTVTNLVNFLLLFRSDEVVRTAIDQIGRDKLPGMLAAPVAARLVSAGHLESASLHQANLEGGTRRRA